MKLLSFIIMLLMVNTISATPVKNTIAFLENKGQIKDQFLQPRNDIDFKLSSSGVNVFIGNGELHYQFHNNISGDSISTYRMDVVLVNANKNASFITEGKQPYYEHYYNTNTPAKANLFTKVTYQDIYPFIDWVLYIKDGGLEYDFVVHKGGNSSDIKLLYKGASSLKINTDGSFTAINPMGIITEAAPYTYQHDGKKIASSFTLRNNTLSFITAPHKGTLIIDPKVEWATYFGGTNEDKGAKIDLDNSGYIYMCGGTRSSTNIATTGSYQVSLNGTGDAYLSKFTPDGIPVWATYYGGDSSDVASDIICDNFNNIYLTGNTASNNTIASPGSHQQMLSLHGDGFLAKFTNDGELLWGTYYGGDSLDAISGVSCDDSSNVLITGYTWSSDNISTSGAHKATLLPQSNGDAFLVKFDSMGVRQWGTYFGGDGMENANGVAIDATNNIYITGVSESNADVATPNAYKVILEGMNDGFISKFTSGGQIIWSTYFGGTSSDGVQALAIRGQDLYITGNTYSPDGIATPGTFQPNLQGVGCGFLARFDTAGNRIWGTYFGVANSTRNWDIAADNSGQSIYFIGDAGSHLSSLATPDAPQKNFGGGILDMLIAKFTSAGMRVWSTYYGSCTIDIASGCAINNNGDLYVLGHTSSTYMATPGSYQETLNGDVEALLIKFRDTAFGITGDDTICAGSTTTYYASFVPGAESYTWTLPNGWTGTSTIDTINVTVGTASGTVSVVANKSCSAEPAQELYVTVHPLPVPIITRPYIALWTQPWFVTYQWYSTIGGAIAGATADSFSTSPGDYYVVVTDTNGCTAQSDTFTITLSVTNSERSNNISLHPNPNTGNFTLAANNLTFSKTAFISITDITGRRILQQEVQVSNNTIDHNIALPKDIPAGQYFLKLTSQEMNRTIKFTKR